MAAFYLKYLRSVSFAFRQMTMLHVACSRLRKRDFNWVGVFARCTSSSA